MHAIFDALKSVNSAFALVGYLAAVGAWSWVVPQTTRLRTAKQSISAVPEDQRIRALEVIYGPIPAHISAEEWIRDRRNRLLLVTFLGIVFAVVATVALVLYHK